ncbi:hypothetical protein EVAR_35769_1 [Eumeta japonica]|uniref:Uncharacterized protein n=1 Tax=Eumeta variegata TaxID=151549 RepID=A0A4C1WNZ2_EUMVA|nr:hypothetical protein EVAR_35769_1 [Eumeta japonica]
MLWTSHALRGVDGERGRRVYLGHCIILYIDDRKCAYGAASHCSDERLIITFFAQAAQAARATRPETDRSREGAVDQFCLVLPGSMILGACTRIWNLHVPGSNPDHWRIEESIFYLIQTDPVAPLRARSAVGSGSWRYVHGDGRHWPAPTKVRSSRAGELTDGFLTRVKLNHSLLRYEEHVKRSVSETTNVVDSITENTQPLKILSR